MALNVNYQGLVNNKDGNEVECKYQAYVPSISKWSDIRTTEECQYNVNFGDGDLKTQSGSVNNGEVILICFWINADSRNERLDQFSVVMFAYDGNDSTVQDVQILPPHAPSCSFGLPLLGIVGSAIQATSYASLTYQWTHNNKTHYQRHSWYSGTVFDFLAITNDDFLFDEEYSSGTSHTYEESSDFTVKHRVINSYDLQSVCEKNIRMKYMHPFPNISFDPETLIIGESIEITDSVIDEYGRITNIEHMFDGESISENTESLFSYTKVLTDYRNYVARQDIHWNDGFDDKIITVRASPIMVNQPPLISLSVTESVGSELNGLYEVAVTARDREGAVSRLTWKISYLNTNSTLPNPFFICSDDNNDSTFREIYQNDTSVEVTSLDLLFAIKGTYKIEVVAYDEQGLFSVASGIITVNEVCSSEGSGCNDIEGRIVEAIAEYEREHQLRIAAQRIENMSECKLVVIQDSLAEDNGIGTLYGSPEDRRIGTDGGAEITGALIGIPDATSIISENGVDIVGVPYGSPVEDYRGGVEGGISGEPTITSGSSSGSIVGS